MPLFYKGSKVECEIIKNYIMKGALLFCDNIIPFYGEGGCKNIITVVFTHQPTTDEAEDKEFMVPFSNLPDSHP